MKQGKQHWFKTTVYCLLYVVTILIAFSTFVLSHHSINNPVIAGIKGVIIVCALVLLFKNTVYMLLCPWFEFIMSRRAYIVMKDQWMYRQEQPLVSVIIPAWNEEVGLLDTVKSVLESHYQRIEIIIINDGSTDDSDRIMRRFMAKYEAQNADLPDRIRLRYHYQANGGKGAALNTGILLARGDIIVTIDADCEVHTSAIGNFVKAFRDPKVMAAVGNVKIGNTSTLVGAIQHLEYLFSFYFKKADSLMNTIYIIGGAAGAFRREVFVRVGTYSTHNITEDIDLSVRIQEAGMKIVYVPDAVVITEGASDLKGLMKQRLRWKRGRLETFRAHRKLFFSCRREHNKLLTWIILPLAAFGDIQLGFEVIFVSLLYILSIYTHDFSAFISAMMIVLLVFFIQLFDDRKTRHPGYLLLAPIGWLLFYVTTFVEVNAFFKGVRSIYRKQEVHWQRWQRRGVNS